MDLDMDGLLQVLGVSKGVFKARKAAGVGVPRGHILSICLVEHSANLFEVCGAES